MSLSSSCLGCHDDDTFKCSFRHYLETQSHREFSYPVTFTIFLPPLPQKSLSVGVGVVLYVLYANFSPYCYDKYEENIKRIN